MTGRTARRGALVVLAVLAALAVAVVAAWALDSGQEGRVARNVTLAGEPVGGLSSADLAAVVGRVAARYAEAPVVVEAPGGGFRSDTRALGLAVQEGPTVEATMAVARSGTVVSRIRTWMGSFFSPRRAPVHVSVDVPSVYRVVAAQDPGPRTPPREPGIRAVRGRLVAVEGRPGRGIDAGQVIERLPAAAGRGLPVTVRVDRGSVAPRFAVEDAARLAAEAEALTGRGLEVRAGRQETSAPAPLVRSWLRAEPTDTGLRLAVDTKAATAGLIALMPKPDTPPKEATFKVVGGRVSLVPGETGTACCADAAGEVVEEALTTPGRGRVELPLRKVEPKRTTKEAAALGIKEQVATFTTSHKPNEPRVVNIHRIADLVRGHIIGPGETFSVNALVGERTPAKGFVVDAVIQDGKFEESVGGGISQFATTAFNAAFFAGLEFAEYQSHSIYISRYPYGREATLSYPRPDLKLRNPSPHGVLVWPTYSGTSITVSLYSTRWVEAGQTGQTTEPRGPCTRVRTERTRRFLADGTTKVDHVSALYRPAEGVNCT
ncbi:MAG: VanW family protein [Actinomycetota bacterium]|nr:VanW family protein [Actinomycetota bacterium]